MPFSGCMNFKNFKIIASFLVVLLLTACGNDACKRNCGSDGHCLRECGTGDHACVDADDWGFPKVWVPASGDDPAISGSLRGGANGLNQYVDGIDSGQVILDTNTIPLIVTIGKRDQWTSWFGGDINTRDDGTIDPSGYDGGRTVPDIECHYVLDAGKSSSGLTRDSLGVVARDLSPVVVKLDKSYDGTTKVCNPLPSPLPTPDSMADCYVPCQFRNGMGLYIGLAPDKATGTSASDVVIAYHIPDAKAPDKRTSYLDSNDPAILGLPANPPPTPTDIVMRNLQKKLNAELRDGYLIRGLPRAELPGAQTGDRLFFKIVDRTYIDNSGGYHVKIKEGTRNAEPGPLEKIVMVFVEPINAIMIRLYNGIVTNNQFRTFVQALLGLYIAFFGYNIMIGGTEALKKDAITRILKVGLIMALISDSSWDFFYNHVFQAFLVGTQSIAALLMNPFGDFDPNNPWYSMDSALAKLWSRETWTKISATFITNPLLSLIFIPGMFWGLAMFMIALVKAVVIYLVMFATIAILITLAPIFIIFMLFEKTKDITKEWYDQLFVAALQQIILMAALGMFATVIVMYLQKTVGYTVCWNIWLSWTWDFGALGKAYLFDFKFWMPDISSDKALIWADANYDGIKEVNEMAYRYIDAPYLDPIYDREKLAQMVNYKYWGVDGVPANYYVDIVDLLFFIGSVFLMTVFMPLVEIVASTLKGGSSMQSSNVFGGGGALIGSISNAIRGGPKGGGLVGGGLDFMKRKASDLGNSETAKFIGRRGAGAASTAAAVGKYMPSMPGAQARHNRNEAKASAKAEASKQKIAEQKRVDVEKSKRAIGSLDGKIQSIGNNAILGTANVLDQLTKAQTPDQMRNIRTVIKEYGVEAAFAEQSMKLLETNKYNAAERAAIQRNLDLMNGNVTAPRSSVAPVLTTTHQQESAEVQDAAKVVGAATADLEARRLQAENAAQAAKAQKAKDAADAAERALDAEISLGRLHNELKTLESKIENAKEEDKPALMLQKDTLNAQIKDATAKRG